METIFLISSFDIDSISTFQIQKSIWYTPEIFYKDQKIPKEKKFLKLENVTFIQPNHVWILPRDFYRVILLTFGTAFSCRTQLNLTKVNGSWSKISKYSILDDVFKYFFRIATNGDFNILFSELTVQKLCSGGNGVVFVDVLAKQRVAHQSICNSKVCSSLIIFNQSFLHVIEMQQKSCQNLAWTIFSVW